jgi:hypothetical protein
MTQITTRVLGPTAKGSPLTNEEVDTNFLNLKAATIGGIFVTDVTSAGNLSKAYIANTVPSDSIVATVEADYRNVTIHIRCEGGSNWSPVVTIDGHPVSLSQDGDNHRVFTGSREITVLVDREILIVSDTGHQTTVQVNRASAGPSVLTSNLGDLPGSQTAVKSGDTVAITGTQESEATHIRLLGVDAFSSLVGQDGNGWIAVSGNTFSVTANVASNNGLQTATLQARNILGTLGATLETDSIACDQGAPSVTIGTITYPSGQIALKSGDTATVPITAGDFTAINMSSSEAPITNSTVHNGGLENRTATYSTGTYRDSGSNLTVTASKVSNDTTTVRTALIRIANSAPVLNISHSASRLRSGGNDNTSIQSHTITLVSDQYLSSVGVIDIPSEISIGSGGWVGSWQTSNSKTWTRTLQIHDDTEKTSPLAYSFTIGTAPKNGALVDAESLTGTVEIGGFVSRGVVLSAFTNEALINVAHNDYSKVTFNWPGKLGLITLQEPLNTTTTPIVNSWCLSGLVNYSPTAIRILDTEATNSSSEDTIVTVEEVV